MLQELSDSHDLQDNADLISEKVLHFARLRESEFQLHYWTLYAPRRADRIAARQAQGTTSETGAGNTADTECTQAQDVSWTPSVGMVMLDTYCPQRAYGNTDV